MLLTGLLQLLRPSCTGNLRSTVLRLSATASRDLIWPNCSRKSSYSTSSGLDVVDCVVVGAGVVGLACARAAALAGYETIILEKEPTWGTETSARHSEVIHAGIYYPAGSLKARLCVEGKNLLYEYCQEKGISHKRVGKLIVASSERQIPRLQQFKQFAAANGVRDLELLSASEAAAAEPALAAAAALLSPSTGIIDSHEYMESLLADASAAGAMLATHSRVLGIRSELSTFSSSSIGSSGGSRRQADGTGTSETNSSSSSGGSSRRQFLLNVEDTTTGEVTEVATKWLVNAAGLHAQSLAEHIEQFPRSLIPMLFLAKGNYFSLSCKAPFSKLVYPLPEDGGLGIHLTRDLAGQAKFGPDVEWVDRINYEVDPTRAQKFYPAIRTYYPDLPDGALQASYAGIRPKLNGPGQPAADFVLQGERQHGVHGLVNLFGIESPGLTSSLAIAQAVLAMLQKP